MTTFLRAVATMPASLWVVASCGVLAGAMLAHEGKLAQAAAAAPITAPVSPPAAPPHAEADQAPAVGAATSGGTPLRFLDSDRAGANATAAKPAAPPKSGSGPNLVVIVLLVAGAAAVLFMKRGAPKAAAGKRSRQLELLQSIRVGGRWQVALVRVPGKTLVLGATEKGLSLLTALDLDDGEDVDGDPLDVLTTSTGMSVPSRPAGAATAAADAALRERVATPPPRAGRVSTPHPDAFLGKLLDELNGAPAPVRERPLTPSAEALRQRLERFQRKAG